MKASFCSNHFSISQLKFTVVKTEVIEDNADMCDNCYCYLCDVKWVTEPVSAFNFYFRAKDCKYWTNEKCRHCNAYKKPQQSSIPPHMVSKHMKMSCWKDLRDRIKNKNNPEKSGWATDSYQETAAPIISAYQREIDEQNRIREASKNDCSDSGWVYSAPL